MHDLGGRLRGAAVGAALTAVPLTAAAAVALAGAPAVRAASAPTAQLPDLLTAVSATGCTLVLLWLAAAVVLSTAATLSAATTGHRQSRPGGRGAHLARWERRASPVLVQRLVATAVGMALGAGATAAHATAAAHEPGWRTVAAAPAQPGTAAVQGPALERAAPVPSPLLDPSWRSTAPGAVPLHVASAVPAAHPLVPASTTRQPLRDAPAREGTVVVLRGDTLWSIATAHLTARSGSEPTTAEIAAEVQRWWHANRTTVGADPDQVHPGQVLHAPAPPSAPVPPSAPAAP